jgi:hypothetical protein
MKEDTKQQFSLNIESLSKLDDHQLEKIKKHWLEQAEASQKSLNKANSTLEVIRFVQNNRKPPKLRLDDLKASTGNNYQELETNSNYS